MAAYTSRSAQTTYSSAHSFSLRICSSSSGVKLEARVSALSTIHKKPKAAGPGNLLVDNVEELANLLGGLALDHVGDGLAANVTGRSVSKRRAGDGDVTKSVWCEKTYRRGLMSR